MTPTVIDPPSESPPRVTALSAAIAATGRGVGITTSAPVTYRDSLTRDAVSPVEATTSVIDAESMSAVLSWRALPELVSVLRTSVAAAEADAYMAAICADPEPSVSKMPSTGKNIMCTVIDVDVEPTSETAELDAVTLGDGVTLDPRRRAPAAADTDGQT